MASQSLSSCSYSSPAFSSQRRQNQLHKPNSLSFRHKKRPRQSSPCLSISSSNPNPNYYPYSNPNPNYYRNPYNNTTSCFSNTFFDDPTPQTLNPLNNDYDDNSNNTTSFFPNTFFDHPTPQTLIPPHNDSFDLNDPIIGDDFSSPEDQNLLASFLADPPVHTVGDEMNGGDQNVVDSDRIIRPAKKLTVVSPQSIAARERRRKISEKTSELGKLIPGGANKMNSTADMFQAAYNYIKFLKAQVSVLQSLATPNNHQEMKEQKDNCVGELSTLASPLIQEKLYREEKCLVPKEFLDHTLYKNNLN